MGPFVSGFPLKQSKRSTLKQDIPISSLFSSNTERGGLFQIPAKDTKRGWAVFENCPPTQKAVLRAELRGAGKGHDVFLCSGPLIRTQVTGRFIGGCPGKRDLSSHRQVRRELHLAPWPR